MIMKRNALPSVFSLALFLGGCPKRQTAPNLVYVPSPPPAAVSARVQSGGTLVIEEPAPPEAPEQPPQVAPQEPPAPKPAPRPRRRAVTPESASEAEPTAESSDQTAAPVPALEPRESPQQESELRNRVLEMTRTVQGRIARLEQSGSPSLDRKTLESARTFLAQSERALESGDLQRALNLARKASLLVNALEQKP
jgi:hypothetical protein